jgi:hypothetical protein
MAVTLGRETEQRKRAEEGAEFVDGARFQQHQQSGRRAKRLGSGGHSKFLFTIFVRPVVHPAHQKSYRHTGMILQRTMSSIVHFKHRFAFLPFRTPVRPHLAATLPFGFFSNFKGLL